MRKIYTPQKLTALALTLLFTIISITAAQDPEDPALQIPSGISGTVVDPEGNPVDGFTFTIRPMKLKDNLLQPEDGFMPRLQRPPEGIAVPGMPRTTIKVRTNPDGTFTVKNIQPGLVQLNAVASAMLDAFEKIDPEKIRQGEQPPPEFMRFPMLEPDKNILSLQVGQVTFFYDTEEPHFFGGLTFALKPGVTFENVKITVESRLRIHGRIVYADGTPLVNTNGRLNMRHGEEDNPSSGGTHGTEFFTDADGYFTIYRDEPGFYTLSLKHKELSGGAGPFLLKDGVAPENLVITLDGNAPEVKPKRQIAQQGVVREEANVPEGAGKVVIEQVEVAPKVRAPKVRAAVPRQAAKRPESVWVINPANGHAYKKIACRDWHDAQQQAVKEKAHLVSINDEAEQHWLQVIFRTHSAWIGLTDVEKEGEWQWDSGEPVTYTNWAAQPIFTAGRPETEKDYVVMTFFRNCEWQSVGPENHFWRATHEAILEKDGLVSKAPVPEASDEE